MFITVEKTTYSESFTIRSSEVRPDGKAKLQTICDLLQEVAGNHALKLNWDVTQLQDKNMTWFLQRLDVQMERYPSWRETVKVKTWPSGSDKLRAHRDFLITDEDGNTLVKAVSYWLMIDLGTRRPTRMPKEVLELTPTDNQHVLPLKNNGPQHPKEIEQEKIFAVRYSDLDVNKHVNNIKYIEWITETVPNRNQIRSIDIEFKAECGYGDDVKIVSESSGSDKIGVQILHHEKGKVLAVAEIIQ